MKKQEEKIKEGDSIFVVWVYVKDNQNVYEILPAIANKTYIKDWFGFTYHIVELADGTKRTAQIYDSACFHKKENAIKSALELIEGNLSKWQNARKRLLKKDQTDERNYMAAVDAQMGINHYLTMKHKFL